MRWNLVKIIFKKEILDIFRDKRVIVSMIIVPLLAFPLLMVGVSYIMQLQIQKISTDVIKIGYSKNEEILKEVFHNNNIKLQKIQENSYKSLLTEKNIHFYIDVTRQNESYLFTTSFDRSKTANSIKYEKLQKSIRQFKDKKIEIALGKYNVPHSIFDIVKTKIENIASKKKMKNVFLALLLPYFLIIISLTGATYPAIDLTVGEKERGTLETLLSSPATRREIIVGKYLTTVLISIITALASLTSFTLTFKIVPASSAFSANISPVTFLISFFAIIPISMIFSALIFAISTFSKSVKEAQSYIQPLTMIVIFPAMVSFLPGIEPNMVNAFIPIINISLLLKSIFLLEINPTFLIITLSESFFLAFFFITLAFRLFDRESIIFKEE